MKLVGLIKISHMALDVTLWGGGILGLQYKFNDLNTVCGGM